MFNNILCYVIPKQVNLGGKSFDKLVRVQHSLGFFIGMEHREGLLPWSYPDFFLLVEI